MKRCWVFFNKREHVLSLWINISTPKLDPSNMDIFILAKAKRSLMNYFTLILVETIDIK